LSAEFGDTYRFENVMLSATHTHSGPAGFLQYVLFSVSSMGFVEQTFQAMVAGIVEVRGILFYQFSKRRIQTSEEGVMYCLHESV
jgi:hypothetical protein